MLNIAQFFLKECMSYCTNTDLKSQIVQNWILYVHLLNSEVHQEIIEHKTYLSISNKEIHKPWIDKRIFERFTVALRHAGSPHSAVPI